jgi:hypothetical protein
MQHIFQLFSTFKHIHILSIATFVFLLQKLGTSDSFCYTNRKKCFITIVKLSERKCCYKCQTIFLLFLFDLKHGINAQNNMNDEKCRNLLFSNCEECNTKFRRMFFKN